MKNSIRIALLFGVAAATAAAGSADAVQTQAASGAVVRDIADPYAHPIQPDGPGGHRGLLQTTHRNCVTVAHSKQGTAPANITWTWEWLPSVDTDGDGRTDAADVCPCVWKIRTLEVTYWIDGEPLEC